MKTINELIKNEQGATITEYALILALVALVAYGAITALGDKINYLFTQLVDFIHW